MPDYDIVDFYYEKVDKSKFKSRENLKDHILKEYDSKGTAKLWMDHEGWDKNVSPKGKTMGIKVDDINEEYIQTIKGDIERANTEGELNKITIDTDYESDTKTILEGQIGEKLEGLLDYEGQADSIIKSVNKADTLGQIDAIDIDIPDSSARTRAIQAWNNKRFEIQERIEKETGIFPGGG